MKPTYEEEKAAVAELDSLPLMTQYLGEESSEEKGKYACIRCNSGHSGNKNSDGAMHHYGDHFYCFSCDKKFKNSDIVKWRLGFTPGEECKGEDYKRFIEAVYEELGKTYETTDFVSSQTNKEKNATAKPDGAKTERHDYSKAYEIWQSNLPAFVESQGGSWRGLSLEDLQKASAGFNDFDDGDCVILPYDKYTYFRRAVNTSTPKMKNKNATVQIYDPHKVLDCGKPLFIVEGEIDCLSILKCGYPCVATGGAGNYGKIINQLETRYKGKDNNPIFFILFDNDDAGKANARKFQKALQEKRFLSCYLLLDADDTRKIDANDLLQKDSDELKRRLKELYFEGTGLIEEQKKQIKILREKAQQERGGVKFSWYFKNQFWEETSRARQFLNFYTNFRYLDREQIWQAGLVTIGAPPSLGKTSFIWQLLEDISRNVSNSHCVFVSYELPALNLFAKSIAREVYRRESNNFRLEVSHPLTSSQIMQGGYIARDTVVSESDQMQLMKEVVEDFEQQDFDLRIIDCSEERLALDALMAKLETIAAEIPSGELLIMAIDYLQLIELGGKNPIQDKRLQTDEVIHRLKDFSNKFNALIFCISSYNRSAYKTDADFSAFKESGGVEYHSDVVWALQLYASDGTNRTFDKESLEKAKQQQPRPMELVCLKNRRGNDYRIYFQYYSACDLFTECKKCDL